MLSIIIILSKKEANDNFQNDRHIHIGGLCVCNIGSIFLICLIDIMIDKML